MKKLVKQPVLHFAQKVNLFTASNKKGKSKAIEEHSTDAKLSKKLGLEPEYFCKLKANQLIPVDLIKKISDISHIEEYEWVNDDVFEFGKKLGLSINEIIAITGIYPSVYGIDFDCRQKDKKILENTLNFIQGYWGIKSLSPSYSHIFEYVLKINKISKDGFILCEMPSNRFNYTGYGFPTVRGDVLYFFLNEKNQLNEILIFMIKWGSEYEKTLKGIALSIGVGKHIGYPTSCKVDMINIGNNPESVRKYFSIPDVYKNVDDFIKENTPIRQEIDKKEYEKMKKIFPSIVTS